MNEAITIGVDIANSVFQIHAIDAAGEPVIRRQLRRRQALPFFKKLPPCLIGIEACATSHYWAREIAPFGHEVRLISWKNRLPPPGATGRYSNGTFGEYSSGSDRNRCS